MRLWHEYLLPYLPRYQLVGQHRIICCLRGKGCLKNHKIINYIFKYNPYYLHQFHLLVLQEMESRQYMPNKKWFAAEYRGKYTKPFTFSKVPKFKINQPIYSEHNNCYLIACLKNLDAKFKMAKENKYSQKELNKFYDKYNCIIDQFQH